MSEMKTLPFYMAYPTSTTYSQDQEMVKDLEYFQQIYPQGAKLLQKEICSMLHMVDYEGSMLYDEYPDKIAMRQLAKRMLDKLMREKEMLPEALSRLLVNDCVEEYMLLILLCEILKRRHKKDKGYLMF